MRKTNWFLSIFIGLIFLGFEPEAILSQEKVISWEDARDHVGQNVIVEGGIVRTYNSGRACFLNFHPDYQNHLSLVIFAADFPEFPSEPEKYYLNKKIRARGRILLYQGRPEIILDSPAQITILGELTEQEKQALMSIPGKRAETDVQTNPRTAREISWEEAADYYGQVVWVRGMVIAANNTGKVCFLNFHRNWKRYFTVVIFSSAFSRFPEPPEKLYLNREIRVYGLVREYQGKPEIIVENPDQIEIIQ